MKLTYCQPTGRDYPFIALTAVQDRLSGLRINRMGLLNFRRILRHEPGRSG